MGRRGGAWGRAIAGANTCHGKTLHCAASRSTIAWMRKSKPKRSTLRDPGMTRAAILSELIRVDGRHRLARQHLLDLDSTDEVVSIFLTIRRNSAISERAVGRLFPKSLSHLGSERTGPPSTFRNYVRWVIALSAAYHDRLSLALSTKAAFERAMLLGDKDAARGHVAHCTAQCGWSTWAVEAELLIAAYEGGSQLSITVARLRKAMTNPNLQVICNYLQIRVQSSTTAQVYDTAMVNFQSAFASSPELVDVMAMLDLRLNPRAAPRIASWSHALQVTSSYSLLDAFLLLQRMLELHPAARETLQDVITPDLAAQLCQLPAHATRHFVSMLNPSDSSYLLANTESAYRAIDRLCQDDDPTDIADEYVPAWKVAPELLTPYLVAARYLGSSQQSVEKEGTASHDIIEHMIELANPDGSPRHSIKSLTHIAYQLDSMPIGRQLLCYLDSLSCNTDFACLHCRSQYTWDTAFPFSNSNMSAEQLTALAKQLDTLGLAFAARLVTADPPDPPLNASAPLVATADTAGNDLVAHLLLDKWCAQCEQSGRVHDALLLYRQQLAGATVNIVTAQQAIAGIYRCLLLLNDYHGCADFVSRAYATSQRLVQHLDISLLARTYSSADASLVSQSFSWPLVLHIHYSADGVVRDSGPVFAAYDNCISLRGAARPSDLFHRIEASEQALFVAFLRDVCTPEILDCAYIFDGIDSLEDERIYICEFLQSVEPLRADAHATEAATLRKRKLMRKGLRYVASSKIHIDLPTIERSLGQSFLERLDHFTSVRHLPEFNLPLALVTPSVDIEKSEITYILFGKHLFYKLFEELCAHFLYSVDFGLDANLSIRIRHGTLSGQLRGMFEVENLVTRRSAQDQPYESNEHWRTQCSFLSTEQSQCMDDHFRAFSQHVDSTIDELKSSVIQIRTGACPSGLFDYSYSNAEIESLYERTESASNGPELLVLVFDELLKRTESNLALVRTALTSRVEQELAAHIDMLSNTVLSVDSRVRSTDFPGAITRCRTSLQNTMLTISDWFKLADERAMDDFEIQTVVTAVIEALPPAYKRLGHNEHDISYPVQWKGRLFSSLFDAFYLLIDNAYKHGATDNPAISVVVKEADEGVCISVSNVVSSATDVIALRKRIAPMLRSEPMEVMPLIRAEGGTGFYKLRRVLRYDLGLGNDYSLELVVSDERVFCATIRIGKRGVKRCTS